MKDYKRETLCVQAGYSPKNGEARVMPIYQSTTYKYDSADNLGELFDLKCEGHMYSRISNPSLDFVEKKIAALESGVSAMLTSSGQAAITLSVMNLAGAGQNIVVSATIYGGTINLFAVTLKRMGIEARFFTSDMTDAEVEALIDDKTRLIYGETIANPGLNMFDIERFANLAHKNGLPLIVDNTFATPILCRPFEFGADIVIHSTTKYMDGHATVVGGCVVDSGNFDWEKADRFPEMRTPDPSYHGVVYTKTFGKRAFVEKARVQLLRDIGATMSPTSAFLLNLGLETLALRMKKHCENAMAVAEFLEKNERVAWVNYPYLPSSPDYALAKKYLDGGASGVISFGVKGGRRAAMKYLDSLKLAAIVVHVADARTGALHPASTTHRQLTDEQLEMAGVKPEMVRMSIGIEDAGDIIADIAQALEKSAEE